MNSTPPAGKTIFGVTVWPVLDGSRRTLSWGGPGDRIHLHRKASDLSRIGDEQRTVSGQCRTPADAQAAVDGWLAQQEEDRVAGEIAAGLEAMAAGDRDLLDAAVHYLSRRTAAL